jgi:hypothetical protein
MGRKHSPETRQKIGATKRLFKDLPLEERVLAQEQRRLERGQEWKERNRDAIKRKARSDYAEDPSRARLARVLWRFRLTPVQWLATIDFQDIRCRCCGTTDPGSVHGWHVDHDHVTDAVRGAVCHKCNTTLGMLGDRLYEVRMSSQMYIRYLETSS